MAEILSVFFVTSKPLCVKLKGEKLLPCNRAKRNKTCYPHAITAEFHKKNFFIRLLNKKNIRKLFTQNKKKFATKM
jgi:hypothetical protein